MEGYLGHLPPIARAPRSHRPNAGGLHPYRGEVPKNLHEDAHAACPTMISISFGGEHRSRYSTDRSCWVSVDPGLNHGVGPPLPHDELCAIWAACYPQWDDPDSDIIELRKYFYLLSS